MNDRASATFPIVNDLGLHARAATKLVQLASIEADSSVLDVGCATGYSTAVLAKLALSYGTCWSR